MCLSVAVVCLLITRDYTRLDASAATSDLGCSAALCFVGRLREEVGRRHVIGREARRDRERWKCVYVVISMWILLAVVCLCFWSDIKEIMFWGRCDCLLYFVFWQLIFVVYKNNKFLSRPSQCSVNTKSMVWVLSEAGEGGGLCWPSQCYKSIEGMLIEREGGGGGVTKSVLCKRFQVSGRNVKWAAGGGGGGTKSVLCNHFQVGGGGQVNGVWPSSGHVMFMYFCCFGIWFGR